MIVEGRKRKREWGEGEERRKGDKKRERKEKKI